MDNKCQNDACPDQQGSMQTDAWMFNSKKEKDNNTQKEPKRWFPSDVIQQPQVSSGRNDLYYNMDHPRRGVALIFNHVNFAKMAQRVGSNYDRDRVERVMKLLGFDTRVYDDLKYIDIINVLDKVSVEDHTDADCLAIVMMTHGNIGILYAQDTYYPVDLLWDRITGDKCPTLAGKPKLIFVQACRGDEVDDGVELRVASTSRTQTDSASYCASHGYTIPSMADLLVMYSTYAGHTSFRIPATGSWFIQALCAELEERASRHTLLDILTFTTRTVAIDYLSYTKEASTDKKKQVPSIVSHLTRLVYFGMIHKKF